MSYLPKDICNLGLGRIAASPISEIAPARTPLERHCANGYPLWKRSELAKNRWVFALRTVQLTKEGVELTDPIAGFQSGQVYRYPLPADCIRPLRPRVASPYQWQAEGRYILSTNPELVLKYIADVPDADLSDEFVDVLAWRAATECVEFATQSNTKKTDVVAQYKDAVKEARKNNAFILGDEATTGDDQSFDWLTSRWG